MEDYNSKSLTWLLLIILTKQMTAPATHFLLTQKTEALEYTGQIDTKQK